jgi:hypothetical protein
MDEFRPYQPCLNRGGDVRAHVDRTIAHRNHLHIGMTKAGAARRTSFWQQAG